MKSKKNKNKIISKGLKSSVNRFGEGRFWCFVLFDFLAFVAFVLVFILFAFSTLKIVPVLGTLTPYSKEVFEMAQEGAIDETNEDFMAVQDNVNLIKSSVFSVVWKILGVFIGCLALFVLIFSTLQFFGWKPFFGFEFKTGYFLRFTALNSIWFIGWAVFLGLTLYLHRNLSGIALFWIELLLMFYFTPFLHISYFRNRGMLESLSDAFLLALRPRSLVWLLIVLLVFVLAALLSGLLIKIHGIMFVFVAVIIISIVPWSKMLLFALWSSNKKEGVAHQ